MVLATVDHPADRGVRQKAQKIVKRNLHERWELNNAQFYPIITFNAHFYLLKKH